jgi:hypothetical protein
MMENIAASSTLRELQRPLDRREQMELDERHGRR